MGLGMVGMFLFLGEGRVDLISGRFVNIAFSQEVFFFFSFVRFACLLLIIDDIPPGMNIRFLHIE